MMELANLLRHSLLISSIGVLAACSSADSTSTAPNTPAVPTTVTLSGSVFASDVSGATVTIKKTDGTTVAGPVTTNSDGTYTIDILDTELASDLVFESTGGGFVDEETRANASAGAMSVFVEGGTLAANDSVHVTPDTTIHANLITAHSKTPMAAQTIFFEAFAHHPDFSVDPVDITDPTSFNADDAARHAGWRAAVFSRLANTLTLTADQQFDMFAAIAQDLSDGTMDGMDASVPVQIGSTGVAAPTLDDYLDAAGSFTIAEAANLAVEYTPPADNFHGKNRFTLSITNNSGPVAGLTDLQVMPMMHMADRIHATPMGEITELGGGDYQVTVYYLMPSRDENNIARGTWDLKVTTSTKTVHFYPNIVPPLDVADNTVLTQLKGINDTIVNMDGLEVPRNYNLFRDNLVQEGSGSNYEFDIFIAPMENMMSFPALIDGDTLDSGMGGIPYLVDGITVEASDDGGTTWSTGVATGTAGVWNFSGSEALTLTTGANEVRIKLTVSNEVKTTNGLAADPGVNDFATFTITLP